MAVDSIEAQLGQNGNSEIVAAWLFMPANSQTVSCSSIMKKVIEYGFVSKGIKNGNHS